MTGNLVTFFKLRSNAHFNFLEAQRAGLEQLCFGYRMLLSTLLHAAYASLGWQGQKAWTTVATEWPVTGPKPSPPYRHTGNPC